MKEEFQKRVDATLEKAEKYTLTLNRSKAKDREVALKHYGELVSIQAELKELRDIKPEGSDEVLNVIDQTLINISLLLITVLAQSVEVHYKARVSVDILESLHRWRDDDGGLFYALPAHQYEIVMQTLKLAMKPNEFDYTKGDE